MITRLMAIWVVSAVVVMNNAVFVYRSFCVDIYVLISLGLLSRRWNCWIIWKLCLSFGKAIGLFSTVAVDLGWEREWMG